MKAKDLGVIDEGIIKDGKRYQGWMNWQTWSVHLWVMNTEDYYRAMLHRLPYTADSVKEFVISMMPHGTPDMKGNKDFKAVCWQEIAEAFNEWKK